MKSDQKNQEIIRLYLLGQATPEDSSRLEEQLFTEDDAFHELLAVEDELVDEYLSDKLSPTEVQSFETHFLLAPDHQRKLRFGRALQRYVDIAGTPKVVNDYAAEDPSDEKADVAKPSPKRSFIPFLRFSNPILSYSLAVVLLLSIGGGSWVVVNNWRQQTPPQRGNVFVATLTPGLTRDAGEIPKFKLPPATDTVEFRLPLPQSDYGTYRSVLLTDNQSEVLASDDLTAVTDSGKSFVFSSVSAKLLPAGDYRMKLSGRASDGSFEDVYSYSFRVTR